MIIPDLTSKVVAFTNKVKKVFARSNLEKPIKILFLCQTEELAIEIVNLSNLYWQERDFFSVLCVVFQERVKTQANRVHL